jgi:hypothetical protein
MKNNECIIYISTKRGYTQIYRRNKKGWTQNCPNGKVRPMTAEQLLSHMLPSLAGVGPLNVRVKAIKGIKKEAKK